MAACFSSKLSVAALTATKPAQRAQRAGVSVVAKAAAGKELSAGQSCE